MSVPTKKSSLTASPGTSASRKRPAPALAPAAQAVTKRPTLERSLTFVVSSKARVDDLGMETLVGNYTEHGENHDRKVFKRTFKPPGASDNEVFLYYWDTRDGPDFSGWWLGDQVGGRQVWSRCDKDAALPPSTGWRVPWDGPVQDCVAVERRINEPKPPANPPPGVAKNAKAGVPSARLPGVTSHAASPLRRKSSASTPSRVEDGVQEASPRPTAPAATQPCATQPVASQTATVQSAQSAVTELLDSDEEEELASSTAATLPVVGEAGTDSETVGDEAEERCEQAKLRFATLESEVREAIQCARSALEDDTVDGPNAIKEILQKPLMSIATAQKSLAADLMAARKEGPQTIPALNKLTPKLRQLQLSLMEEVSKLKAVMKEKQRENADAEKKRRDAELLEQSIPVLLEVVTQAVDAVDSVALLASPLLNDTAGEIDEAVSAVIKEIEAEAATAQASIAGAKKKVSTKLLESRVFVPEVKKVATVEYTNLQEKLTEAQQRLAPYLRMRSDYQLNVETNKVMDQVTGKLAVVDVEIERLVHLITDTPTQEEVKVAESAMPAVLNSLHAALRFVDQKAATAQGQLKQKLVEAQGEGMVTKKRIDDFKARLTELKEFGRLEELLVKCVEMAATAETLMEKTTEAEGAFLKGFEIVPVDEARTAIAESEEAAKAVDLAVASGRTFVKQRLAELAKVSEGARAKHVTDLNEQLARIEDVATRVAEFKKETQTRKVTACLQEITEPVVDAETKVRKMVEAAGPLAGERAEEASAATLKAATEKAMELEKVAAVACADARKTITAKQKANAGQAVLAAECVKMLNRMNVVQAELGKQRRVVLQGEKTWRSKQVVEDKHEALKKVDEEMHKLEMLSCPLGDERPSDESIKEMASAVKVVQASLTEVTKSIESSLKSSTGSVQSALHAALEKAKATQAKLNEVKAVTEENSDRLACEDVVKQAQAKMDKIDLAFHLVTEAEAPYLKGNEVLEADDVQKAMGQAETAIAAVQAAISEARTVVTTKSLEVKKFKPVVSKFGIEEMAKLTKKIEEDLAKVAEFKNETADRKKVATTHQALQKVALADEGAKKVVETVAQLAEKGSDELSMEETQNIVVNLQKEVLSSQAKIDDAKKFLAECQRKREGDVAQLSKLQGQLNSTQVDLAKAKTTASEHEQRIAAKFLLFEATALEKALVGDLESAAKCAAPLVAEGGRTFIVASMTRMIVDALTEYMGQRKLSPVECFQQIEGFADDKVGEDEFIEFLGKLPQMSGRQDISFSEDQRGHIFEHVAGDEDAEEVTLNNFTDLFIQRFMCVHSISVTESFDITESKTVAQLEVDDVCEAVGDPRTHDTLGVMRLQVRLLKEGGATGWVTMQGNQGIAYMEPFTAYAVFVKKMDRALLTTQNTADKLSTFLSQKVGHLTNCKQGPLADAKAELLKVNPRIAIIKGKMDALKTKVEAEKRRHAKREEVERKLVEEKMDRKAAQLVLQSIHVKMERVRVVIKQLEESAAPLTSGALSEVPLSVKKAVGEVNVASVVSVVKATLKAHEGKVQKTSGSWFDAKQEMEKLRQELVTMEAKARGVVDAVGAACESLAASKYEDISQALRTSLKAKSLTADALYTELRGTCVDVTGTALKEYLLTLDHLQLSPEQGDLVFEKVVVGGTVSRRTFIQMVERYMRVLKEIAFTSEFDINKGGSLRKLEKDEFFEVLEGPKSDPSTGLRRVRARALVDNSIGWVTVKGNHGTPFAAEASKPSFSVCEAVHLESTPGETSNRTLLRVGEVLEVLQGPRTESVLPTMRARGKTVGGEPATGWFTVKDRCGKVFAEPGKSCYTVASAIALTDELDMKASKILRKLLKGELLSLLDGPVMDENGKCNRIKVKTGKDGKEGWVTLRGNAGTVYVEETGKQYVIRDEVALQGSFETEGAQTLQVLPKGSCVELLVGPKEEVLPDVTRVSVCTASEAMSGWVTLKGNNLRPWSPQYRCVTSTVLHNSFVVAEGTETVRKLAVGETVELLEGPKLEPELGVLRMRAKAAGGAEGWVTITGSHGKLFLECVAPT